MALGGERMSKWQPIETAPKEQDQDGLSQRIVLGFAPDEENYTLPSVEGFWQFSGRSGWRSCMDPSCPYPLKPTHWAPMPKPPTWLVNE